MLKNPYRDDTLQSILLIVHMTNVLRIKSLHRLLLIMLRYTTDECIGLRIRIAVYFLLCGGESNYTAVFRSAQMICDEMQKLSIQ